MKDSLPLSPPSKLQKANTIGQLDDVGGGYTSDSAGSSNDSLFFSETSRSTKRQRQMATRKKNSNTSETPEKGGKKRVASASAARQEVIPEKRQKTVEPAEPVERVDETAALPVRSMNPFKTTVQFIIGPDEEEFQVHSFLLESTGLSAFFDLGKSTGPVKRPDLDSKAFTDLVEWLYGAHMRPGVAVDTAAKYNNLIDLYSIGQKMGGESWMKLVMKQMLELFDQTGRKVPAELASVVYEKFSRGSGMRRLWVTLNVVGEMEGECANVDFLQEVNRMQRSVIQKEKIYMESLLEPFRQQKKPPGPKPQPVSGEPSASQNGTTAQPAKGLVEKQRQQQEKQSQPRSQPETASQPNGEGRTQANSASTPQSQRSQKSRGLTTCEDLLRKFQSGQPKDDAA
ncbi:uncharacterized protein ARB_06071 [Trichophyton benhamiae CBS 112371]|uniref:BTB domain-containing protein n=1 Tax=Arthroderma benhamiae (strain ATCC MYA-4681 / CBS 112371) TaxID=663331 RepID=D4APA4_ARTBC|nr:uncharacterized protein ARB_06071 [Trichophyton benhamiae CBS 112371]EFE35115.1 hypothetical protein ARB_06071 [Trichophyton benhamiae CBS 112371]